MSATSDQATAAAGAIPALSFAIAGVRGADHAAAPTLEFELRVVASQATKIRSILLDVQIQIAPRGRGYAAAEEELLLELFGTPERWATTLRTLLWTRVTVVVPPFEDETSIVVPVPCTYDLEVIASRYFAALRDGEVPLEFLFSGTVFFASAERTLQATRIGWDQEATYRMPVAVWRQAIERHFPGSAWLRLGREPFERLCAYKAREALPSFDAALDALLDLREGT